ncbi:hypothetical protein BJ912DRAFT_919331 [Pholiota molesta]|nr:hypothetical protein BJ912DRAFT_919331 [Pholiota molesta]
MANLTYLGPVPKELSDLTVVEEAMIARCRSKCWVIQLKEEDPNSENTVLPPMCNVVSRDISLYILNDLLKFLEDEQILPFHLEHILTDDASETLTSRYDQPSGNNDLSSIPTNPSITADDPFIRTGETRSGDSEFASEITDVPFQNVVITDVDGNAPANELRAAALRHVKRGGGYLKIPHDPTPVNEFLTQTYFL